MSQLYLVISAVLTFQKFGKKSFEKTRYEISIVET
jgi:hypothetical protein